MLMLSSPTVPRAALMAAQQLQRCAPLAAPLVVAVPSAVRHDFHSRFGECVIGLSHCAQVVHQQGGCRSGASHSICRSADAHARPRCSSPTCLLPPLAAGLVRSRFVCHAVQQPAAAGEIKDGTQTGSSIPPSNGSGGAPTRKPIDWEEAGVVVIKVVFTVGILALLALLFKPMLAFLLIGPVIWVVYAFIMLRLLYDLLRA